MAQHSASSELKRACSGRQPWVAGIDWLARRRAADLLSAKDKSQNTPASGCSLAQGGAGHQQRPVELEG